jgi:DNA polymerase V
MTGDPEVLREAVSSYAADCARKLRHDKAAASRITVFLQTNRFRPELPQYNNIKVIHLPSPTNLTNELVRFAVAGFMAIFKKGFLYKKAGVLVGNIIPEQHVQQSLFEPENRKQSGMLMKTLDKLTEVYGKNKVRVASQGFSRKWKLRQERLSGRFTTRWEEIYNFHASENVKK